MRGEVEDFAVPTFVHARQGYFHTPGTEYPPGKYVKDAWNDLLFDRHIDTLTQQMAWRRTVGVITTRARTRRYHRARRRNPMGLCRSCQSSPQEVRDQCRPCYGKAYYQTHKNSA